MMARPATVPELSMASVQHLHGSGELTQSEPSVASISPSNDDVTHRLRPEPRGILRDDIQYRLNIGRRAGDNTQDFTGRGLLLQRFFKFLKQPHVLDGDHGLVSEGFEELDLRWGEGAHFDATRIQCSNEFPLLTKGNGQEGAPVVREPNIGKSFCARTSGIWSAPCSRIQRNCGSSILISARPMGTGPK